MADIALAGIVVASHYAAPVQCRLASDATLFEAPDPESAALASLKAGEMFDLLDDSLGWAWGYAGEDRSVGYVRSEAIA